ncbi:hypothetical protein C9I49_06675 [Pseudomonas prosekii]|uniref:Uncharacterized protein n=1 Tax=Pseudomonas prosekii TaxID=1148509 RepID=A0A2U2DB87_9PSED|nr:hypothetical protein C9I49_06675 [Pseudomonas prosekii]
MEKKRQPIEAAVFVCARMRRRQAYRHREQAHSYKGEAHPKSPVGAELARDGGPSATKFAECATPIASKLDLVK